MHPKKVPYSLTDQLHGLEGKRGTIDLPSNPNLNLNPDPKRFGLNPAGGLTLVVLKSVYDHAHAFS